MSEQRADIIVVGAGIAGAAAFIEAVEAGANVIALDQGDAFGGTACRAGAACSIAGSPTQAALGIADDPEAAIADLLADNDEADPDWAAAYYRNAVPQVHDWLTAKGITFARVGAMERDSVPRWHAPEGGGAQVMGLVWDHIGKLGRQQDWHFGMRVTGLIREGGRVAGVEATDSEGAKHAFRAPAVIMATGGICGSLDMIRRHAPRLSGAFRVLAGGGSGARGTGHGVLEAAGASLDNLHNVYTYAYGTPDYRDPSGERGVVLRGTGDWIWVNRAGQRFTNEARTSTGHSTTDSLFRQDEPTAFAIFDAAGVGQLHIMDHYHPGEDADGQATVRRYVVESPHIWRADTIEDLAVKTGLPVAELARTVADWNRAVEAQADAADPATGRALAGVKPIAKAPFYAAQLFPTARKTLGGVRTDLQCRVLGAAGQPIPGLYAAGELAGYGGGHFTGSKPLEGLMIGGSLYSGRVAGREAAAAMQMAAVG